VVTRFWEKIEQLTLETRVQRGWPQYDDGVEYLYNVMKSHP
jgi:hypothetical protein